MYNPITPPSTKIEIPEAPRKPRPKIIEREKTLVCRVLFPDES